MPEASHADFELGRNALLEITAADTIGKAAGSRDEGDGVITVFFDSTLGGYRGWRWTVTIAHVDGLEPSVLETELTPGEGALLSPDWVPWADRMADYRAAQEAAGAADEDDEEGDDEDDFVDDLDDHDDFDHSDDFDGVDIDAVDLDGLGLDGIDIDERADSAEAAYMGVDESDDADGDAGDARPEPPVRARRSRARNGEKKHEGEQPEG